MPKMSREEFAAKIKHASMTLLQSAAQAEYGSLAKSNDMVKEMQEYIKAITTGEAPRVPITTKKMPQIRDIFGLRLMEEEGFGLDPLLKLEHGEGMEIPELVTRVLKAYALATRNSPQNEQLTRSRVDVILFLTLAERKEEMLGHHGKPDRFSMDTQASAESYLSLSCQMEMHIEMPGKDGAKDVLWTGRTDYSYWYGSPENAETNLIVVETKKKYTATDVHPQTFGYMAIIHTARKQAGEVDASVYGISTDDFEWKFYCIDHESRASCITFTWHLHKEQIILLLNRIINKASGLNMLSSTLSRTSSVSETTGINIQSAEDMEIEEDGGNEDN